MAVKDKNFLTVNSYYGNFIKRLYNDGHDKIVLSMSFKDRRH